MMMEGVDETFDGVIFIGYHTGTSNTEGVRAHTLSSGNLTAVTLNGVPMLFGHSPIPPGLPISQGVSCVSGAH